MAAIAIVTFAATQALRAAADDAHILWSSETPVAADWSSDAIKVTADKLEALKVGDILHVVITGVTPGTEWSAQVAIKDEGWKDLEAGVPVGKGDVTDVTFLLTGDILTAIKANGVMFSGTGYSATQVYYEDGTLTGSEKSVWIGNTTTKPTINKNHLANVKAGDVIRVSATATEGFEGDKYFLLSYSGEDTGWGWVNYEGMPATATATGFDFVVNEANVAQIKTDGIIINQDGYTITQVELLPTYEVTIGEGITGGKVSVDKAIAAEGDEVTITATPNEGYKVKSYSVTGVNTNLAVTVNNGKFKMPADAVTVSVTFNQSVDVTIAPASGDISEALNAAIAELGNNDAKNITINLAENGVYTISNSIIAGGNVAINGAAGAVIDASALTAPFIKMSSTPAVDKNDKDAYPIDGITIKDVTINKLSQSLVDGKSEIYYLKGITIDNSVINVSGSKHIIDFQNKGLAEVLSIKNSTLWASDDAKHTGRLYQQQSGKKPAEVGAEMLKVSITNSTLYNISNSQNYVGYYRENSKPYHWFEVQNSVIVNCATSGNFVKSLNQKQVGANANWNVDGNVFNWGGADTSADEVSNSASGVVKNSIAGVITFTDAANGDFNGSVAAAVDPSTAGDPRWTLTPVQTVTTAASGYTTLVSVYPLDFTTAAGLTAYVVAADEDIDITNSKVKLTQVTEAAANTPVILLGAASTEYTITAKADAAAVKGNLLKGSATTATTLTAGEAYLLKDGKFGLCTEGELPAGKAYLPVPAGSASNELIIVIDGEVTGIDKVVTRDALENAKIYNLQGQEVKKAGKGIYIINGKKVVMK